ncbi:MAG: flagellar assembly protein FliW [Solirubrobacteraceae bacterium]
MTHTPNTTMTIQSSRFGSLEVQADAVIDFPDGLIGLRGSRYTLIANNPNSPFLWLHSLDDGALALPVANPQQFFAGYKLELGESEAQRLGLDEASPIDLYVTVRAAPVLSDFVANLRAPIVIHAGVGHQVINQAAGCELRAPLFPADAGLPAQSQSAA